MENAPDSSCPSCGSWWRLPLLLALVLAAIVWWRLYGHDKLQTKTTQGQASSLAVSDPRKKVTLNVDFGGGRRNNFDAVPWRDGMTVADLLHQTPGIVFAQKGSGQSALLTTMDGVENQGTDGNNWTYFINGKLGDRSFAVYPLQPGDQVLWTFGPR